MKMIPTNRDSQVEGVRRVRVPFTPAHVTVANAATIARLAQSAVGAADHSPYVIGNLNLHGLYLYMTNHDFRTFTDRADVVVIDGFPIWLLCRARWGKSVGMDTRVGSTDWLEILTAVAPRMSYCALGAREDASQRARQAMLRAGVSNWIAVDGFDGVAKLDSNSAPFSAKRPMDITLVGMGMPTQEHWILNNFSRLQTRVIANVGGYIDYIAGEQALAPRWMGRVGIEWVYRLLRDPKRLWRRYLCEPIKLMGVLASYNASRLRK